MKLNSLYLENFQSVKKHKIDFDKSTSLIAENGAGKTTRYNAFMWLLFAKNAAGKSKFPVKPLDQNEKEIEDVVTIVEGDIDGVLYRHELHNKSPKNRYWINEVPKSEAEYNESIASLVGEDQFKILTDLYYVNETMHWSERRELLLAIAGDIPTPEGFAALLGKLNGRTLAEYKKVISDEKKRLNEKQSEISPRIDEIQRGMSEYIDVDADLQAKRDKLKADLDATNKSRNDLLKKEKERQNILDEMSKLRGDQLYRESVLANDTSRVVDLLDEKRKLQVDSRAEQDSLSDISRDIEDVSRKIETIKRDIESLNRTREELTRDYMKVKSPVPMPEIDTNCPTCARPLPEDDAEAIRAQAKKQHESKEAVRMAQVKSIEAKGKAAKADVDEKASDLVELEIEAKNLLKKHEAAKHSLESNQAKRDARIAEIQEAIDNDEKVSPEDDAEWRKITKQMETLNPGESMATKIQILEDSASEIQEELAKAERTLAQSDRLEQDKERINELKNQEKELSQKIASLDADLDSIGEYTKQESAMIEKSVNGMFKHIKWRLFDVKLNGNIEDTCVATMNGVPYEGLSDGEKIKAGLDLVSVLSRHYGLSVPLFIDRCESYTGPVDMDCQVIKLIARKGVKKLQIEKE